MNVKVVLRIVAHIHTKPEKWHFHDLRITVLILSISSF